MRSQKEVIGKLAAHASRRHGDDGSAPSDSHNAPALPDGDLFNLQRRCAEAIRAIDPDTPIVIESMHCSPSCFAQLSALKMDNVIYQVHLYLPHDYTHQGILTAPERVESWPDPKKGWNRDFLLRSLKSVIDFQREHDAKMYVG